MADAAAIGGEVERLIRDCIGRPALALSATTLLADIPDMDSLRLLECVALAERHFVVEVSTDQFESLVTVGDIVRLIAAARPADPAGSAT
jgi:acyl carrier protein